eukprot:5814900-Amphidinium_carterae.1
MGSLGRPSVGSVSSNFEAVLRSDLLERMPKAIVERLYAEGRLSSIEILGRGYESNITGLSLCESYTA